MAPVCRRSFILPFAAAGVHRRNLSVFRIDDQRCAPRFDDVGPSIPPEVVVGTADVGFRRTITAIHVRAFDDVFLVPGGLLFRKKLLSRKLRGTLKRSNRSPTPCALQIGLSIRRME